MTSVVPFEPSHAGQILDLWRALHPDWTWLDGPDKLAELFGTGAPDRIGFVVQRQGTVIASVLGTCSRDKVRPADERWPRNRWIQIETRPADVAAEWLAPILASFADADRERADIWHVVNVTGVLLPALTPLLETAGFVRHSVTMRMEWSGASVTVADPGRVRLERYAGGSRDIDRAIADLHNRSFRPARLVPPLDPERLWQPGPGPELREYVLAMENDRVVGYAEWYVTDGKPWIESLAVARSHWGTAVAAAIGTKAMQILVELGHRDLASAVRSSNAASMRLIRKLGWRIGSELVRTFVRRFGRES